MFTALIVLAAVVLIARHDRQKDNEFERGLRELEYEHRTSTYGKAE
jgi:hypothetical protein